MEIGPKPIALAVGKGHFSKLLLFGPQTTSRQQATKMPKAFCLQVVVAE